MFIVYLDLLMRMFLLVDTHVPGSNKGMLKVSYFIVSQHS